MSTTEPPPRVIVDVPSPAFGATARSRIVYQPPPEGAESPHPHWVQVESLHVDAAGGGSWRACDDRYHAGSAIGDAIIGLYQQKASPAAAFEAAAQAVARGVAAGGKITAPFTPAQVIALRAYQENEAVHAFTCACRGDGLHDLEGLLVPTLTGWICPFCSYTQDWAHASMVAPQIDPLALADRNTRQDTVAAWCRAAFGEEHTTSIAQRGVRLLEESIEAAQAAAVPREMATRLVHFVYDRPPGELAQELGGVGLTLLALANAAGHSADHQERTEVERVLAKPLAHFTKRNLAKNAAGFGLAPAKGEDSVGELAITDLTEMAYGNLAQEIAEAHKHPGLHNARGEVDVNILLDRHTSEFVALCRKHGVKVVPGKVEYKPENTPPVLLTGWSFDLGGSSSVTVGLRIRATEPAK